MYEQLKALINQYIKTNGSRQITGAVLNNVLNEMVNSLGGASGYGGIITPTSQTPANDANIFYIAIQQGNYTNFGITVNAHELAFVKRSGNGWAKDAVPLGTGIVANPTGTATEQLDKIEIDGTIYTNPQGPAGHDGADGQDAYQPFKGTFATQEALEAAYPTPNAGDTAYVEATVNGNDVLEVWDVVSGAWNNTHRTVDSPQFESGEFLNTVNIDDTHLANPAFGSLAKAEDAAKIRFKTKNSTAEEVKITNYTVETGHIVFNSGIQTTTSSSRTAVVPLGNVGEYRKVRFLGLILNGVTQIGFAFYDANGETLFVYEYESTNSGAVGNSKEYEAIVPRQATTLKATIKRGSGSNTIVDDFYCYMQVGEVLQTQSKYSIPYNLGSSAKSNILALLNVKLGITEGSAQLQEIPFTWKKDTWNVDNHSFSASTTSSHFIANVEGFSYIVFLGRIANAIESRGWAFFNSSETFDSTTLISDNKYDDDPSASATVYKIYIAKVPQGALTMVGTIFDKGDMFVYGYKGNLLIDDIKDSGEFLPSDALSDYMIETSSSINLIDWNNLLEGEFVVGKTVTSRTPGRMTNKLYLEDGKYYTFQNLVLFGTKNVASYARYKEDGTLLGSKVINNTTVDNPNAEHKTPTGYYYGHGTFKYKNEGEDYIRFVVQTYWSLGQLENIQLEEGEEASQIVEYEGVTIMDIATKRELEDTNNEINKIEEKLLKNLAVSISKDNKGIFTVIVRSALSKDNDCAFRMRSHTMYNNPNRVNNITLKNLFIGSNESVNNVDLCADGNKFLGCGDSIAPLNWMRANADGTLTENGSVPIFHQHGFSIASFTPAGGTIPLTDPDDIDSVWTGYDADNNVISDFVVGRITSSYIYLVPLLANNMQGEEMLSCNYSSVGDVKKLVWKSGGIYTTDISGSSQRYDLPVQIIESIDFLADGKKITIDDDFTYGEFQCNEFIISQNILGKTPFGFQEASDWWGNSPIPEGCHDFIRFTENYIFGLNCCTYNVTMNAEYPFLMREFRFIQPMFMGSGEDFNSIMYIPKAKDGYYINNDNQVLTRGIDCDKGFAAETGSFYISRRAGLVYDTNNLPERCYCVLENTSGEGEDYIVGLASGMSLNRGASVSTVRNNQIVVDTGESIDTAFDKSCMRWFKDLNNKKVYPRIFFAKGSGEGYEDGEINTDFIISGTAYFSIFDPNVNPGQQVFWYKESDYWILYAHAPELTGKQAINLPPIFEGMQVVETIEKTNGVTLLTDVVASGRIYVKYTANSSGQANFITFKLK